MEELTSNLYDAFAREAVSEMPVKEDVYEYKNSSTYSWINMLKEKRMGRHNSYDIISSRNKERTNNTIHELLEEYKQSLVEGPSTS